MLPEVTKLVAKVVAEMSHFDVARGDGSVSTSLVLEWRDSLASIAAQVGGCVTLPQVETKYRCDFCGSDYYDSALCCERRKEYLESHASYREKYAAPPAEPAQAVEARDLGEAIGPEDGFEGLGFEGACE